MTSSRNSNLGIGLLGLAVLVGGIGGVGLLRGMSTRSLSGTTAVLLGVAVVLLIAGLVLTAAARDTRPPRFCMRCHEVMVGDGPCPKCP